MKNFILAGIALAVLTLSGCATSHNDQRNCTTDCHIGGGTTVVTPGPGYGYVAAPVYRAPPRYMAPSLYHPYRGYGHGYYGGPGFRLHMGGTVIIR